MSDEFRVYYKIDPREPQLPKWVQEHIDSLRRSIRTLKSALDQDVSDSDTFIHDDYSVPPEPIGKGTRILFKPPGERWPREFDVRLNKEGRLEISSSASLIMKPTSSNRLEIWIDG